MATLSDGRAIPDYGGPSGSTQVALAPDAAGNTMSPLPNNAIPMASLDPMALGAHVANDARFSPSERATAGRIVRSALKKKLRKSD